MPKSQTTTKAEDPMRDLNARLLAARQTGDPKTLGNILGVAGRTLLRLGNAQEALVSFKEAYDIASKAGHHEDGARHLGNQGIAHMKLGQLVEALDCFDKVLEQSEQQQLPDLTCDALLQKATLHIEMGRGDLAYPELETALKTAEDAQDEVRKMRIAGLMGISHLNLASVEEAARYFEMALEIAIKQNDTVSQGGFETNLGTTYLSGGAPKAAIKHFEEALRIAHEIQDEAGERNALLSLVKACAEAEDPEGVKRFAGRALDQAKADGDVRGQIIQLNNLILTASKQGKSEDALPLIEAAIALAEQSGEVEGQLNLWTTRGNFAYEDGDLENSLLAYQKAREFAVRLQKWDAEARLLGRLSAVEADSGHFQKSLEYAFQGMKLAKKGEDKRLLGEQLMLISMTYRDQNDLGEARKYAEEAKQEFAKVEAPQTLEQINNYLNELSVLA